MDQPFTDKQVADALKCLTPAMPRALLALPHAPGVWLTVSEMRHRGCTGSNVDVLHSMNLQNPLCLRRWRRWGGEPGQKRDVGYEYSITPLGVAVRNAFASPDAAHEPTEQGSGDLPSATGAFAASPSSPVPGLAPSGFNPTIAKDHP